MVSVSNTSIFVLFVSGGSYIDPLHPVISLFIIPNQIFIRHSIAGMGDSCCDPRSIGKVASYIQEQAPGIIIHSIATGEYEAGDVASSYFGSVDDQIDRVCDLLRSMKELQHGYVAVGFSQGGQFLRGVIQRCQHRGPMAHTLVTMGAQHQGVMDVPGCWEPSFNATPSWACRLMQRALGLSVYADFVQSRIIQAQYFKDPEQLDTYFKKSAFLADINTEAEGSGFGVENRISLAGLDKERNSERYAQYKTNLASLEKLVLFMFDNDVTVVPKESAHFGFFDGSRLVPLNESGLYKEDNLGLQKLDNEGKLVLAHAPGFHMQFSLEWFWINVVEKHLLVERSPTPPEELTGT